MELQNKYMGQWKRSQNMVKLSEERGIFGERKQMNLTS